MTEETFLFYAQLHQSTKDYRICMYFYKTNKIKNLSPYKATWAQKIRCWLKYLIQDFITNIQDFITN